MPRVDHVRDGVAAAAADADDLDDGALVFCFNEFEHRHVLLDVCETLFDRLQLAAASVALKTQSLSHPSTSKLDSQKLPWNQLFIRSQHCRARCRAARRAGRACVVLAAEQQQADAGRVNRIAHDVDEAGDVLRHAEAHRHVEHFLGELDDAFHLRRCRR